MSRRFFPFPTSFPRRSLSRRRRPHDHPASRFGGRQDPGRERQDQSRSGRYRQDDARLAPAALRSDAGSSASWPCATSTRPGVRAARSGWTTRTRTPTVPPISTTANCSRGTTSTPSRVPTPDHWHAIIILDTCKAGKDMYCEKPLTNNIVEAKAVMDAVKKSGIVFQTGSQQRSSSNFRHACELVRNGYLGKISKVEVGVGGLSATVQSAGRRHGRRSRLGTLARCGPDATVQFRAESPRQSTITSRRGGTSASTVAVE